MALPGSDSQQAQEKAIRCMKCFRGILLREQLSTLLSAASTVLISQRVKMHLFDLTANGRLQSPFAELHRHYL